ncbi:sorbitol dehydrogenase-like isoform X2 [Cimex lectularius]|uniref:Sorbitol dehydrogenase n=1 Tax=Cimex lectularius TaxID=79782 RepID=A0A8I6RUW7_CIMLE|nr:sorbitol dehydrogenase-like isoform X2 [Cimex lectularius]
MACDNLTAVLYKTNDLRLENRPIPEPTDNEVLLEMGSVSICGSDVHYLQHGRICDFIVKEPMIMGHEASGTVVKLGSKVKNLNIGDRVAIEPGVPCSTCEYCKEGRYNLCPDIAFCATPPFHGNLSRFYCHKADFCFKLPHNVSLEEGALLEPLSVGVHACKKAEITIGSKLLVLGVGPIGLVTTLIAKAMGAEKIIATDLQKHRLELAKICGADHTVQINGTESENDLEKVIRETLGGQPDKTIDCSGFESSIRLGLKATKSGGTFVLVGMGAHEVKLPLVSAAIKEITIKGAFRYCNDYAVALSLVATGKVNLKPLITHEFSLKDTIKAFETASNGTGNPVKILIHCNK